MIDREGRAIVLTCDGCGRRVEGFDTFSDALAYIQDCGWTTESTRYGYENRCLTCAEEVEK